MPNWVKHKLQIKGQKDKVEQLVKLLHTEKKDYAQEFDFNKIKPMPEELNIVSGSYTDRAVELYLTSINPKATYYGDNKLGEEEFSKLIVLVQKQKFFGQFDALQPLDKINNWLESVKNDPQFTERNPLEYGKRAVDNIVKYGAMDWYSWSIANWDTKWNACHVDFDGVVSNENYASATYLFDTAWSDVRRLIGTLAEQHPTLDFELQWAEEQTGYYTGFAEWEQGELVADTDYDSYSKESYELYFELWGEENKKYYRYNEALGTYEYIEDEEEEDNE